MTAWPRLLPAANNLLFGYLFPCPVLHKLRHRPHPCVITFMNGNILFCFVLVGRPVMRNRFAAKVKIRSITRVVHTVQGASLCLPGAITLQNDKKKGLSWWGNHSPNEFSLFSLPFCVLPTVLESKMSYGTDVSPNNSSRRFRNNRQLAAASGGCCPSTLCVYCKAAADDDNRLNNRSADHFFPPIESKELGDVQTRTKHRHTHTFGHYQSESGKLANWICDWTACLSRGS